MELRDALAQITEIRAQMARTETFRGYRSGTVAFTGLLAGVGAVVQAIWIPEPAGNTRAYLVLWGGLAVVCLVGWGVEMVLRCQRASLSLTRQTTMLAMEQFFPCVVAGGLLTLAIATRAADHVALLPGLWAVTFSLGVFASCRLLPRPIFWVAAYYLAAGVAVLVLAQGDHAFSPWAMVGTFGVGQSLTAVILYVTLERTDAEE